MEIIFLILALILFFYLFSISKDKNGTWKLERREIAGFPNFNFSRIQKSGLLLKLATILFVIIEIIFVLKMLTPIETLIKVRASQLIPDKFTPIARFAANMNWDTHTINLDASMSKAYEDKISNYIWRIDDGTSLVGSKNLEHHFADPGYYFIQLSVVDADNQSDVATCQILIPPQDLEKIPTHERVSAAKGSTEEVQDVDYQWVPKGTFFNYSKMGISDQSYANLKSHYIESGCGYSNKTYNTTSNSYIDFIHDSRVQVALAQLLRTAILAIIVVPAIYLISRRYLR